MRIGVDLGGTKTESVAIDDTGTERARLRVSTPSDGYDAIIASIVRLVRDTEACVRQTGTVGIGIPGAVSPATGLVKNANTVALIGHPLDRDLARALDRPVRVANDANCFVLSEASDGAGAGARVVFGVIVGTGTGGGVVVDGKLLTGPHAIAGEWGHNPLPWPRDDERPGPPCYCGKSGCIETFLAGPSLARDHRLHTGETRNADDIAQRAEAGDAAALASMIRYEDRMARGLASIINLLDPDVIVMGGGVSNIARLYREVPSRLGQYVFSDTVSTPIVPARHGDSSGVRGAAWLWPLRD
ncbi:MAG TPA: ROK family protein [Polyangia bacterium]|jgi:Transcriptional regulator/sugar kinase|nr:ROK family protein [Polyangia bacterium]